MALTTMDATSQNVLIVATNPLLKNVPVIFSAFDTDEFLTINNPDTADMEVGADNVLIAYEHPALVTGSLKFAPFSSSIAIIQYLKGQTKTKGAAFTNLYITNPNLDPAKAWFVALETVVFKTTPILSSANKRFQGMTINWTSGIPEKGLLAEALDIAKIISSAVPFIP